MPNPKSPSGAGFAVVSLISNTVFSLIDTPFAMCMVLKWAQ